MALAPSGNGVKQKGPLNVLKSHIAKEESKIKCKFGVGKKGPVTTNTVTDAAHFNVSIKYPWPVVGKMLLLSRCWERGQAGEGKQNCGLHVRPCDLRLAARIGCRRRPLHSCCLNPKRVLHLAAWPTVQLSVWLPASTERGGEGRACWRLLPGLEDDRNVYKINLSQYCRL